MNTNGVFSSGHDPNLNACVGENTGSDDDYGYVVGFAQAALVLIAAAKRQVYIDPDTEAEVFVYQDALIYPICFSARHHIELFLKRNIKRVASLRNSTFNDKVLEGHDLGVLLDDLRALCKKSDRRLTDLLRPPRPGRPGRYQANRHC